MADPTFWHELADNFLELHDVSGGDDGRAIEAMWTKWDDEDEIHWRLTGESLLMSRFETSAIRAGLAIEGRDPQTDPREAWYEKLYESGECGGVRSESSWSNEDGTVRTGHGGTLRNICSVSARLCFDFENQALLRGDEQNRAHMRAMDKNRSGSRAAEIDSRAERSALRDAYFSSFDGPKIKVLDLCWAAGQHYSEWKTWLRQNSPIRDGSVPDKAFRAILISGKRPEEYRRQPRPDGWK